MPYTQEQLEAMPTEKLLELKQQLMAQSKTATPRPTAAGMLVGGLAGGLRGLAGKPPEANPEVSPLEKMYYANMLKGSDPLKEVKLEMEKTKLENLKQKQEDTSIKNQIKTEKIRADAQEMTDAIDKALKGARFFGPLGEMKSFPVVTGLDYDERIEWESNMDQLLAKKGLDIMMQLKDASKTGATGFGNLSEAEGQWLRQASTALNKKLAPKTAKEYLIKMRRLYQKVLSGDGSGDMGGEQIGTTIGGQSGTDDFSAMSDEELMTIARGQ